MTVLLPDKGEPASWEDDALAVSNDWYQVQPMPSHRLLLLPPTLYTERDAGVFLVHNKDASEDIPPYTDLGNSISSREHQACTASLVQEPIRLKKRSGRRFYTAKSALRQQRRIPQTGRYHRILYKNVQIIFGTKAAKRLQRRHSRHMAESGSRLDDRLDALERHLKELESRNNHLHQYADVLETERDAIAEKEKNDRLYLLELEAKLAELQGALAA